MTDTSKPVIQIKDLGKCYNIYDNPKDRLKQALWKNKRKYYREFWALKDISLNIMPGEGYGIIGRNGSGKSTLLQLICGTLTPTTGSIRSRGRVAALLELGSGFNPEFTGKENVYLNASMLGLSQKEINDKLDSILAFAEIGEFINQPVKTYSSGMAVRLAFAIIAHVDADILVIDEALAVGDAIFVQRCMKYIRRMREEKCLLFVSHDAWSVKSLCSHAVWLSNGRLQAAGYCKSVALDYLRYCQAATYGEEVQIEAIGAKEAIDEAIERADLYSITKDSIKEVYDYKTVATTNDNLKNASGWKTGSAELVSVSISKAHKDQKDNTLRGGEEVDIIVMVRANTTIEQPVIGFTIANSLGQYLVGENTFIAREWQELPIANNGDILKAVFRMWFPMLPAGEYALMASIADGDEYNHIQHHWTEDAVLIHVAPNRMRYGLVGAFINSVSLVLDKEI